jgi:hypothetical protein
MRDDDTQRLWHFKRLRWSLQALRAAGDSQRPLFPDDTVDAGDLALDFDHWSTVIRDRYAAELSEVQAESLAAIDRKLATMSRDGAEFDVDLWTEAALTGSEHWADVRELASYALEAFGWNAS